MQYLFLVAAATCSQGAQPQGEVLSATIENVEFQENTSSIVLDFVLTNHSKDPVTIAERWNSLGAYQWSFLLTNSKGSVIEFANPQMAWFANFLTVTAIKPSGEYRIKCSLLLQGNKTSQKEVQVFTPSKSSPHFSFPVRLIGVFTAPQLYKTKEVETNWKGQISTPEITLNR